MSRPNDRRLSSRYPSHRAAALCSCTILAAYASLHGTTAVASSYTAANTIDLNPSTSSTSDAYAIAGNVQAGGYEGFNPPALVWSGTARSATVPPNSAYPYSHINGTTGVRHIGDYSTSYATLWTPSSSINLNPAGFSQSHGLGIASNQQVGWGYTGPNYHALLWTGSAASVVDLTPTNLPGLTETQAFATDGTHQAGRGAGPATSNANHALLWSGTPNSTVDLHPTNLTTFFASGAFGISGAQVVGYGAIGSSASYVTHALLWSAATADSVVDLHPTNLSGIDNSHAYATNGVRQVGDGSGTSGNTHALAWFNTADSAIDLNPLVPGGATSSSARSLDAYGNVAGYATFPSGATHAVVWLAGDMLTAGAGTSGWTSSSNWTAGIPTASTDVQLVSSDALARTVDSYSYNSAAATLIVDATNGGTMKINQQSGTLTVGEESIGFVGTGTFAQSYSTHTVTGTLTLGVKPGALGTYSLGTSATLSAATLQINPGSSFSQTGGTLTSSSLVNDGSFTQSAGSASLPSITGSGSLTLSGNATLTTTSLYQSSLSLSNTATGKLTPSQTHSALASLTLSDNASLNLTTDTLEITYLSASPINTIRQYLLNHLLTSSSTDPTHRLAYSVVYSTLIIHLSLTGDANLDGVLNADDYALLDRSYARSLTSAHWTDGDFNYDGLIDQNDYLLIDTTLFSQAQGFSPGFLSQRESQFGPQYVSTLLASVPEPTAPLSSILYLLSSLPLTRRRRRPLKIRRTFQ